MRVFLSNLGCKLNQAELEAMARQFTAAGHLVVASLDAADVHVVNSCTVTAAAARDSRKLSLRARRTGATARTVLTGCYSAAAPDEAAALAGVDLVVPNDAKRELVARVEAAFGAGRARGESELPVPYVPLAFGNARALVKIEDGCDMACAFCIIPLTRGRQRSRPADEVVAEVDSLARGGFPEVVVTGVQISSYRDGGHGLYELVRRLLRETPVRRLRLTSIAPWQFDERLLGLFDGGRLCRHFHLSLQSGCDATLRRMRRPYTGGRFARLVEAVRAAVPGVAITTDVIAGFPGETDEEFDDSLARVESLGFAAIHAFPFSPRPGTAAAETPGQPPRAVVRERMARLLAAGRRGCRAFRHRHLGTAAEVLWEERKGDRWRGTTDNYIRVAAAVGARPEPRSLTAARLVAVLDDGMLVEPAGELAATA